MANDKTNQDFFYLSTGKKIRRIRKRRNIGIKYLADVCNVTETAVRYYESGTRQIHEERLKEIAKGLCVSELALKDHRIETVLDSLYALFDMESRGDVFPCQTENGNYALCMNDAKLSKALMEWYGMYQKFNDHTITLNEYLDWKDQYPQIPVSQKQPSAVLQQQSTEPEYEMIVINGKKYKLTPVE